MSTRSYFLILILLAVSACKNPTPFEGETDALSRTENPEVVLDVPASFVFETERDMPLTLRLLSPAGEPIEGATVAFSRVSDGSWFENRRRISAADGTIVLDMPVSLAEPEVGISVLFPGFADSTVVSFANGGGEIVMGGLRPGASSRAGKNVSGSSRLGKGGGWDSSGVPDNLEPQGDEITAGLLATVNASLPEQAPVPTHNAHYLTNGDTDVHISKRAEVWITFVHEGAGWKNALGYYTYPTGSPPQSVADIADKNIIFPNVSLEGSGGGLRSGDKVYLGEFSAGTSIGWFLVANGWKSNPPSVGSGNYTVYSNPKLNPESDPAKRQHAILLSDVDRELMLIAFEDVNRDWSWSDEDFNDAIFYVTATPFQAITSSATVPVTDPGKDPTADTDRDGVPNGQDIDPYDRNKAYVEYDPAQFTYGSLIFEDLWPQMGDYDFNDLVMDYNTRYVVDNKGAVASMSVEFVIRAIGAGYRNGLGFELGIPPGQVKSVSGQSLTRGYTKLNGNGTEAGQPRAVIIAFEDAYDVLPVPSGDFANTRPETGSVGSESITIQVEFNNPIARSKLGNAPYNIFMIVAGDRGREIHLPGYEPTPLANRSHFGSGDDASNAGNNYTGWTGLPWVMQVPRSFDYPRENAPITKAHKKFRAWAESGGSEFKDWYMNKPNYRSERDIY